MDEEITELVEELDNALAFVQDVELLRNKLEQFTELIEQVLQVIKECSESINKYLDSNKTYVGAYFAARLDQTEISALDIVLDVSILLLDLSPGEALKKTSFTLRAVQVQEALKIRLYCCTKGRSQCLP